MRFMLQVTSIWSHDAEEILEKYPTLKDFSIETVGEHLYITLNGLEDLMALSEKYGELVINACDIVYGENIIEIYDFYRE